MGSYDESTLLRDRDDDLDDKATRHDRHSPGGARARLLRITVAGVTAGQFYTCQLYDISGTEVENGTATFTGSGVTVPAYNLGSNIPAVNSTLIGVFADYRWTFFF